MQEVGVAADDQWGGCTGKRIVLSRRLRLLQIIFKKVVQKRIYVMFFVFMKLINNSSSRILS